MHSPLLPPLVLSSYALVLAALGAAALTGALAAALVCYCFREKLRGPAGSSGPSGPSGPMGARGRDADQYALDVLTELRTKWRHDVLGRE